MITPVQAFVLWFDALPNAVRAGLANLFWVCTTDDATLMTQGQEDALVRFRLWIQKRDFPLRIAARIFYVRSVFDLVMLHHGEILKDECGASSNIVALSGRQWETVADAWVGLRNAELSDRYVHSWASHVIQVETEEVC